MRYSLLAFLTFFLLLGTSCRKKDSDSDLPPGSRLDSVTTRLMSTNPAFNNSIVGSAKFKYNGTGNLIQHITNNDSTTQFRYDAQNRLITVSHSSSISPAFGDTLVYSANGHIIRSYRFAAGTTMPRAFRTYMFDNSNRLIMDSIYTARITPSASYYLKYSYYANDDIQSIVVYMFDPYSPTSYTFQDSTVCTYDGNESPIYRYSFAIYSIFHDYPNYSSNVGSVLSKHNLLSLTPFYSRSNQPGTVTSYSSTYYANGLIRNQIEQSGLNTDNRLKVEYMYR